jgi:SAM-dependent methyltransferase
VVTDEVERWSYLQARLYALISANPRSNAEIVRLAAPRPTDRVLDIGCGPGAAVRRAAALGAEATGIDPSPAMVRVAQRRSRGVAGVRFVVGDAAHLPLDDDTVTLAWTVASLHHWPDREAGLAEIHRVLVPRGRLLIGERRVRRKGHGLAPAQVEELASMLRELGYSDVTVQSRRLLMTTMIVLEARTEEPAD